MLGAVGLCEGVAHASPPGEHLHDRRAGTGARGGSPVPFLPGAASGRSLVFAYRHGLAFLWERSRPIPLAEGVKLPGSLLFIQSEKTYPTKPYHIGHVGLSEQRLRARSAWPSLWRDNWPSAAFVHSGHQGRRAVRAGTGYCLRHVGGDSTLPPGRADALVLQESAPIGHKAVHLPSSQGSLPRFGRAVDGDLALVQDTSWNVLATPS